MFSFSNVDDTISQCQPVRESQSLNCTSTRPTMSEVWGVTGSGSAGSARSAGFSAPSGPLEDDQFGYSVVFC